MDIKPIGHANFNGGKVILRNMENLPFKTHTDIKEIARRNDYDIVITKFLNPFRTMKNYQGYSVLASREHSVRGKETATLNAIIKKDATREEVAQRIYDNVVEAADKLMRNITDRKLPKKPQFAKKRPNPFFK